MQSTNIVLTGKQQVELKNVAAPSVPDDGILVRTQLSLISTGTESICYRGEMDEGSHWDGWVKYPFNLGYSNVGRVEASRRVVRRRRHALPGDGGVTRSCP